MEKPSLFFIILCILEDFSFQKIQRFRILLYDYLFINRILCLNFITL